MNRRRSRDEGLFADPLTRPEEDYALPLRASSAYSFGMPHSPAAMSRRFISGVMGTAPSAFSRRRRAGNVVASFFNSAGFRRTNVCLTGIVVVMRFEVFDGMIESLIEIQGCGRVAESSVAADA